MCVGYLPRTRLNQKKRIKSGSKERDRLLGYPVVTRESYQDIAVSAAISDVSYNRPPEMDVLYVPVL